MFPFMIIPEFTEKRKIPLNAGCVLINLMYLLFNMSSKLLNMLRVENLIIMNFVLFN